MRYSSFQNKTWYPRHTISRQFRFSNLVFAKIRFPIIFCYSLKHFGIIKWIITGVQGFENPEIITMSSFDV